MAGAGAGLWRNNKTTPEGKYPVVLRRDGTIPEWDWFVLGSRDPAAPAALRAYARECQYRGMDPVYWRDVLNLADEFEKFPTKQHPAYVPCGCRSVGECFHNQFLPDPAGYGDPDKGPHRKDDPLTLALANGKVTLDDFLALFRHLERKDMNYSSWYTLAAKLRAAGVTL